MKRTVLIIAAAICLLALLAGCGTVYTGVWKCAYMDTATERMTAGDLEQAGSELYIELQSGGRGSMTADGETEAITWKANSDRTALLLTVNGVTETFLLADDGLEWSTDDVTVTFLKEKSDGYKEALSTVSYQNYTEDAAPEER